MPAALPSFSHDQHHETDAAKRKGGTLQEEWRTMLWIGAGPFADAARD